MLEQDYTWLEPAVWKLQGRQSLIRETIPILIESLNTLCMIREGYIAIHKPELQFKLFDYDFLSIP